MATPVDPKALRQFEEAATECERTDDWLGALDIYEELVRRGWAGAKHLTGLGHCYLKNRQRQNAKETWLEAFELDPNFQPVLDALDKFFAGWDNEVPTRKPLHKSAPAAPPPPPPASFSAAAETELTVEVTSTTNTPAAQVRAFAPQPAPEVDPRQRAYAPARPAQAPPAKPAAPAAKQAPQADLSEARANWNFVLSDAAEEAAYRANRR